MGRYLLVADSGLSVFGSITTAAIFHRIEKVLRTIADFVLGSTDNLC
jgi:hypothetical protein